ncbi:hypothetical protein Avbf_14748 [Armadillidium vulgare]|nr:hypothetical protein Avbf_14748 [Armadillidium vulgare]
MTNLISQPGGRSCLGSTGVEGEEVTSCVDTPHYTEFAETYVYQGSKSRDALNPISRMAPTAGWSLSLIKSDERLEKVNPNLCNLDSVRKHLLIYGVTIVQTSKNSSLSEEIVYVSGTDIGCSSLVLSSTLVLELRRKG